MRYEKENIRIEILDMRFEKEALSSLNANKPLSHLNGPESQISYLTSHISRSESQISNLNSHIQK